MAANYKKYLAEKVLNEQEIVTYRSLSRALKVHSNLSKQMLYEFHRVENSKKKHSVNATYLITGTQAPTQQHALKERVKDGEDEIMQSSPFMSSQVAQQENNDENDDIPTTTITLVREEDLPEAKSLHKAIFSTFMYSVEPARVQDLNVLSDIGHDMLQPQPEDPLEYGKQYGMILNRNVKRRSGLPPAPPPPVPIETVKKPKLAKTDEAPKTTKVEEPPQPQAKNQAPQASSTASSRPSSRGHADKSSSLKRDTSNIFKAFAKSKPKVKKDTPERSSGPEVDSAEPNGPEDVALDDSSEEEREDLFLDTGTRSSNSKREARKEREEKLRKMMEDEEMTDAPEPLATEEPEPTETSHPEEAPKTEPEEEVSAPNGRRRGRRQVMKKKTIKDAEGYLVTKEEPVWESFSEDEAPPPAKRKPAVSVTPKPSSNKGSQKTGQGNIMSFFGKKRA